MEARSDELHLFWACNCAIDVTPLAAGLVQIDIAAVSKATHEQQLISNEHSILISDVEPELETPTPQLPWPINLTQERNYFAIDEMRNERNRAPLRAFRRGLEEQLATSSTNENLELSGAELMPNGQRQPIEDKSREELLELLSDRASFFDANTTIVESADPTDSSVCNDGLSLNVSTWADASNFSSQLSTRRSDLHAEFDVPDLKAAEKLIQFYLYFNLADEALQLLETYDIDDNDKRLFTSLGKNLIATFLDPQSELAKYSGCLGEKGFWGSLNTEKLVNISDEKIESLVAVFSELPPHLQAATADHLISILTSFEHPTAAGVVRNILTRNSNSSAASEMADDLRSHWPVLSVGKLTDLVEIDNANSPLALAILLEKKWQLEIPPDPEMVELAAAFAFELNGNELAKRLNSARIFSLLQLRQENIAINTLISSAHDGLEKPQETLKNFILALVETAPIAAVSEFAWKASSSALSEQFSIADKFFLAQHFLKFGQPQIALFVLPNMNDIDTPEQQRVRSQIEILMGRPPENFIDVDAQFNLDNFPILESFIVKEYPEKIWAMQDQTTKLDEEIIGWLAQEWDRVPIESSRGRLARLLSNEPPLVVETERPISEAQNAFERSQNLREILTTLMNNDG
ncbi:MAG: hypothetical protein ABJ327_01310 [Litoreibacter sp.]